MSSIFTWHLHHLCCVSSHVEDMCGACCLCCLLHWAEFYRVLAEVIALEVKLCSAVCSGSVQVGLMPFQPWMEIACFHPKLLKNAEVEILEYVQNIWSIVKSQMWSTLGAAGGVWCLNVVFLSVLKGSALPSAFPALQLQVLLWDAYHLEWKKGRKLHDVGHETASNPSLMYTAFFFHVWELKCYSSEHYRNSKCGNPSALTVSF